MRNKISNKIIAGLMLMSFVFSNGVMAVSAMENAGVNQVGRDGRPVLRDDNGD